MFLYLKKNTFCYTIKHVCRYFSNQNVLERRKPPWRIMFFGSDNFSLYTLKSLYKEHKKGDTVIDVLDVVTNSKENPVWKYADEHNLNIQKWPPSLSPNKYDLGLVVSFGHLIPESMIKAFPLGMLNIHASLLPRWRGAAPIIYALAKGDKETGVSVMRIRPKKFDVGEIILQKKVDISENMNMPELHETLGKLGADCLIETLKNLENYLANSKLQKSEGITYAPKISPEFGRVIWNIMTSKDVFNLQRALKTLLPLTTTWNSVPIKLIDIEMCESDRACNVPGYVFYDRTTRLLKIECAGRTFVSVKKIGVSGKKVMTAIDFNNGFLRKQPANEICSFK